MIRLPRFNLPDISQYVAQRGDNKQVCFFNDGDFEVYLEKRKLCEKSLTLNLLVCSGLLFCILSFCF